MTDGIVIRITGDSGDGVQLVGEQLMDEMCGPYLISLRKSGHPLELSPEYPGFNWQWLSVPSSQLVNHWMY
jgi:hypothetical protein